MDDEGESAQIFALAVRLVRGETVAFADAFGNEYLATERLIVRLPTHDTVCAGDAFEIAKDVRALVSFRPARAAAMRRAGPS